MKYFFPLLALILIIGGRGVASAAILADQPTLGDDLLGSGYNILNISGLTIKTNTLPADRVANIIGDVYVDGSIYASNIGGATSISAANVSAATGGFGSLTGGGNYLFNDVDGNPLLFTDAGGGYVGIGTISPDFPLHVNGGVRIAGSNQLRFGDGNGEGTIAGYSAGSGTGGLNLTTAAAWGGSFNFMHRPGGVLRTALTINASNGGLIDIYDSDGTLKTRISGRAGADTYFNTGNVGIGTTNSAGHKLNVNGTLNATAVYQGGVTTDSLYLAKGGSWAGDLASNGFTRYQGSAYSGGEFVMLGKGSQMYTLIDGSYYAYENGGFYSSPSSVFTDLWGFNGSSFKFPGGSFSGDVGIGTPSPGAKLEVVGQIKIAGGAPGAGKVLTSSDSAGLGVWQALPSPPVTSVFGRSGAVTTSTGDYTVSQITGAAPLASPTFTGNVTMPGIGIWKSDGAVGIGTPIPGYKLDVAGGIRATAGSLFDAGAGGTILHSKAEGVGKLRIGAAWGIPGLYSGDDGAYGLVLGVPSGQSVSLGTSGTFVTIAGGSGNIYTPGDLVVQGNITASNIGGATTINAGNVSAGFFGSNSTNGNYTFTATDGSVILKTDAESKYVGIGTASPGAKLDIAGGGGVTIDLNVSGRIRSNSVDGGLWLSNAGDGFVGNNSGNIGFWTSGVGWALQIIKSNGYVGIGTTNPSEKVSVKASDDNNLTTDIGLRPSTNENTQGGIGVQSAGVIGWNAYNKHFFNVNGGAGYHPVMTIMNDNVGIGTTGPTIKLAIGDTDTGLDWVSDGVITVKTNAVERVKVDASGKVFLSEFASGCTLKTTTGGQISCGTDDAGPIYTAGSGIQISAENSISSLGNVGANKVGYYELSPSVSPYPSGVLKGAPGGLAWAQVTGADIADSAVTNAKLANSSLTVSGGTGLSGGGSVALGGSTSLNLNTTGITTCTGTTQKIVWDSTNNKLVCATDNAGSADSNNYPTAISFSGTNTKTLTLSRSGLTDLTANFSDIDTDTDTDYRWDGGLNAPFNAVTGRSSLGLGSLATLNAVTGANIADGSITGADIADGTITGDDIAYRSINGYEDIALGSISGAMHIANNTITSAHIADGNLNPSKLNTGGRVSAVLMTDSGGTPTWSQTLFIEGNLQAEGTGVAFPQATVLARNVQVGGLMLSSGPVCTGVDGILKRCSENTPTSYVYSCPVYTQPQYCGGSCGGLSTSPSCFIVSGSSCLITTQYNNVCTLVGRLDTSLY